MPKERTVWFSRALIALVLFSNLLAAVLFLARPQDYLAAYELTGPVGVTVVQGVGLLFVMWNVPYAVALVHPVRFRVSLLEAIAMQTIAVIGETLIRGSIPMAHGALRGSLQRFIVFDVVGLALLLLAFWISRDSRQRVRAQHDFVQ